MTYYSFSTTSMSYKALETVRILQGDLVERKAFYAAYNHLDSVKLRQKFDSGTTHDMMDFWTFIEIVSEVMGKNKRASATIYKRAAGSTKGFSTYLTNKNFTDSEKEHLWDLFLVAIQKSDDSWMRMIRCSNNYADGIQELEAIINHS